MADMTSKDTVAEQAEVCGSLTPAASFAALPAAETYRQPYGRVQFGDSVVPAPARQLDILVGDETMAVTVEGGPSPLSPAKLFDAR